MSYKKRGIGVLFLALIVIMAMSLTGCKSSEVKAVENQINQLGEISLDSEDKIKSIEDAIDELSEEDASNIENIDILKDARAEYEKLVKEKKEKEEKEREKKAKEKAKREKIKENGKAVLGNFTKETDEVEGITFYTPASRPQYIDITSYIYPYLGYSEGSGPYFCYDFNYTGDDWIFWHTLTFSIDGSNRTFTPTYTDITHDNDNGVVWEDLNAAYDETYTNEYLYELFDSIAKSDKTIVRYEGDDYRYDHTITSAEKKAMKDTLKLYDYLQIK